MTTRKYGRRNDPDKAALAIQSVFRGRRGREEARQASLVQTWNVLDTADEKDLNRSHANYQNLKKFYEESKKKQPPASPTRKSKRQKKQVQAPVKPTFAERVTKSMAQLQKKGRQSKKQTCEHQFADLPHLGDDGQLTLEYATKMINEFQAGKIMTNDNVQYVLAEAQVMLSKLPNVVMVQLNASSNLTVVGDLHGQLLDLLTIFRLNGLPSPAHHYIFNGDFVDRGSNSCEIVMILLVLKLLYPDAVHLNRGNHESEDINSRDGFEKEVSQKYPGERLFEVFCDAFALLPLATVIDNKIFVVHGGLLSQEGITLADLNAVDRVERSVPDDTLMEDLLWSDPTDSKGKHENDRGAGIEFGPDVTKRWLKLNDLKMVVRSHQCVDAGFEWSHGKQLLTVFSASNYCDVMTNKGAIAIFQQANILKPKLVSYKAKNGVSLVGMQQSLRHSVVNKLLQRIAVNRLGLLDHYSKIASEDDIISRVQWANGLRRVMGLDIRFLSFQRLLGLPELGWDGKRGGDINYVAFLSTFRPVLARSSWKQREDSEAESRGEQSTDEEAEEEADGEEEEEESGRRRSFRLRSQKKEKKKKQTSKQKQNSKKKQKLNQQKKVRQKRKRSVAKDQGTEDEDSEDNEDTQEMGEGSDAASDSPRADRPHAKRRRVAAEGGQEQGEGREEASEEQILTELTALLFIHRYELSSLFRFFDLDGDGTIDKRELRAGLMSLGLMLKQEFSPAQVEGLLRLFDANEDGEIQYDEFLDRFKMSGWTPQHNNDKKPHLRRHKSVRLESPFRASSARPPMTRAVSLPPAKLERCASF